MCEYKITWDADAGGSQVQGLIWLRSESKTSLGNLDFISKKVEKRNG